jgi:phenylalanyl-tRNA synthetase beta chain
MRLSINWLRTLVECALDGEALAERLTMAGLEVEGIQRFADFSGVVVAEVRKKKPHPAAAKLTLVDVWDGREVTQVVCGAPNVPEAGARVLWARPGARLPDGRVLEAREVRGVVSPGMLCAEDELGLGAQHEGIVVLGPLDAARPGDDAAAALELPDTILEVNVTPNRPDCLGHLGLAREVAAITGARFQPPAPAPPPVEGDERAVVELEDAAGCPRYTALLFDGVKVAQSPLRVRARLGALGVRAISNVVDATNLVLLEWGQPLHAFDRDRLAGDAIVVRRARADEAITTLDGVERRLVADDVAICDRERAVAVAGVMGGATSEVSDATTRALLESAYFTPARIRRTAKRLGLHSEASHRFERGVDPDGVPGAALRCAEWMARLSPPGAKLRLLGPMTDRYPVPLAPRKVQLRVQRTTRLLGVAIPADEQARLLAALGLETEARGETLVATVPPRRPDLLREEDLIEEVARLHGYDRVPATMPALHEAPGPIAAPLLSLVRDALAAQGLDEVQGYAFLGPRLLEAFAFADARRARPIRLANPLREELSLLRTALLPGLLQALRKNLSRGVEDVRLFEVGEVFLPHDPARGAAGGSDEETHLAAVWCGATSGWLKPGPAPDFFDLRGVVEGLLERLGHSGRFVPSREGWLHPGAQAEVWAGERRLGHLGELHPDLAHRLDLEVRVLCCELDLGALGAALPARFEELPRFPAVVRDLSFFVDAQVSAAAIAEVIDAARDPLVVDVRVREDYREPGRVPEGKKGMLWSVTYRAADRTLTDGEVEPRHAALVAHLEETLGARHR